MNLQEKLDYITMKPIPISAPLPLQNISRPMLPIPKQTSHIRQPSTGQQLYPNILTPNKRNTLISIPEESIQ